MISLHCCLRPSLSRQVQQVTGTSIPIEVGCTSSPCFFQFLPVAAKFIGSGSNYFGVGYELPPSWLVSPDFSLVLSVFYLTYQPFKVLVVLQLGELSRLVA